MKRIIQIYKKDHLTIISHIRGLMSSLSKEMFDHPEAILKKYKYIYLSYSVDSEFKQNSPSTYRNRVVTENIGSDKSHHFTNVNLKDNDVYISSPYIHHSSGNPSISVVRKIGDSYHVIDINMILLLEELRLIEYNSTHEKVIKAVYIFGASILGLISFALMGYGAYVLLALMFAISSADFLHDIFKSIVAVTIGLAMFDLSRQIIEHEVLFKSFDKEENREFKILGKFLVSIVIALSIETLMVVFKIVLDDYQNMLSAFYLLIGTTVMFVGLAYFQKTIKTESKNEE
ncbi:MAG: hypothetical protein U9N52_11100 [Campylobacterota bacterium]|nr:hypothetical protein [Campylobacterota bacterium]